MLTLKRRNIVELPFEVLEQAHWRPSEAQLCCQHKPDHSEGPEYSRLRALWRRREVNFNFSLDALLMGLHPSEFSRFASALSGIAFDDTCLFDGYSQELKKIIGVPDLVISDGTNCVLGENKIAAGYEIGQFIKYQTFAMLCRAADSLPSNLVHVIVVQDTEPGRFISDFGKAWRPDLIDSELFLGDEDRSFVLKAMTQNIVAIAKKFNLAKGIRAPNVLTVDSLEAQAGKLTRTIVISWHDFVKKFDAETNRPDLQPASRTLLNLGMGNVEIEMSC